MFINVNNIRLYYEKKGEGNPLIQWHELKKDFIS